MLRQEEIAREAMLMRKQGLSPQVVQERCLLISTVAIHAPF